MVLSMRNFWIDLPRPFFVQAPMENVTDAAFRRLIAQMGRPDVMYTEFTSADGLVLAPEHGQKVLHAKLAFSPEERPIVAQLFSAVPERMEAAARIVAKLGFDGIDINMGCPDKAVEKSGSGAALIKNPSLARALIRAAERGSESVGRPLPISVKTRIGYSTEEIDTWLPALFSENIANLSLHLRTRTEMSDVPAHWELMPRIVSLRDHLNPGTLITGNGDVHDLADARAKAQATRCDGVMLGRAIYGYPWLYAGRVTQPSPEERIAALAEHIRIFDELLGDFTNFATMKKHFKAYLSGWDHAKELRSQMMRTTSAVQALAFLQSRL